MISQKIIETIKTIKNIQDKVTEQQTENISNSSIAKNNDLCRETLISIYNKIVEINVDRRTLNALLVENLDNNYIKEEIIEALNFSYEQERVLRSILFRNLSAQSIDIKELLNNKQINTLASFNSLLVTAARRLQLHPTKEQLEDDIAFLKRKFNSLPEYGVMRDISIDRYTQVISQIENKINESI